MNGRPLTEFLLNLATSPDFSDAYVQAGYVSDGQRQMLIDNGVTDEPTIDAVINRDSGAIHDAVMSETGDVLPAIYCGKVRMYELAYSGDDDTETE